MLSRIQAEESLRRVGAALQSHQIRFVVLKGLALSYTLYPNVDCRPMSDLDVLVAGQHAGQATAALRTAGFHAEPTHSVEFDREFGGELALISEDPCLLPVELHWKLLHYDWFSRSTSFAAEEMLAAAAPCAASPESFWTMAWGDSVQYLALHLAVHHAFEDLWLFVDLDRLTRNVSEADWELVVQRARARRISYALYFSLDFTRRLLRTPIPASTLAALRPPAHVRRLVERLVAPETQLAGRRGLGPQGMRVLHFLLMDQPDAELQGLWRVVFPGRTWLVERYRGTCETAGHRVRRLALPAHVRAGVAGSAQALATLWRPGAPELRERRRA